MPKKSSSKKAAANAAAPKAAAALAFARAQLLIKQGRIAEARRLLTQLAKVKGPYQARARLLLVRLAGLPARLVKMGRTRAVKKARKGTPVKKARSPVRPKKAAKKKGGGGGGGAGLRITQEMFDRINTGPTAAEDFTTLDSGEKNQGEGFREEFERIVRPRRTSRAKPPTKKPKPEIIRRTPHIQLPDDPPKPDTEFTIHVYADTKAPKAGESGKDVTIEKEEGVEEYSLEVWVAGTTHFTMVDKVHKPLILNVAENATKKIPFQVRVAKETAHPERAALFAYFSHQGRPCGQVRIVVALDTGAPKAAPGAPPPAGAGKPPAPPPSSLVVTPGLPAADLTIEITDPDQDRQNLYCRITTRLLPDADQPAPDQWKLPGASGPLVIGYMKQFTNAKANAGFSIAGAGRKLWDAAPEAFKTLFWKLIDKGTPPGTILVMSDEPNIPWELMAPYRKKDGKTERRNALGADFNMGRWIKNDHLAPPPVVPISDSYVIAPTYTTDPSPLSQSAAEVTLLQNSAGGVSITPVTLDTIRKKLKEKSRSLLHFVCHGKDADEGEVQSIFLDGGDEELTSLELPEVPEFETAFARRPMVFLNACEVGRPKVSFTGIGGFAATFVDLGAAAVIAPLWSVKDTIAYDVAKLFYDGAVKPPPGTAKKTFAETMRDIRKLAYDPKTGEDTYAAYCYYGDPAAGT